MTEPSGKPEPYRVIYSEQVRIELQKLVVWAKARGLGPLLLKALQDLDKRLHIYPQFGQPLQELILKPAQRWIGVVPPLVVHYVLNEERRLVFVAVPLKPLPRSGL
jgi:hypothetical protein